MMREMTRDTARTWAEISLGNLEHNYRALRACAPGSRFLATVKANGYGHGAVPVARRLTELGTDYLAVACLEEGAALRAAGITAPVLVLGHTQPELAAEVVATLPCGMGVMACTRPVAPGWRQVFSGRLCGWVMDEFLEPLEAAEADDG